MSRLQERPPPRHRHRRRRRPCLTEPDL